MSICPIDYSMCADTVTIYRLRGDQVIRQAVRNCLITWEEKSVTDAAGTRMGRNFLLILPGNSHSIYLGDRVYDGIGPEITAQQWHTFIPACVPGLGQVNFVKPCRWEGEICHIEAGNRRTAQPQL